MDEKHLAFDFNSGETLARMLLYMHAMYNEMFYYTQLYLNAVVEHFFLLSFLHVHILWVTGNGIIMGVILLYDHIDILKFNLFLLLELCTRTTIAYENINSCISCLIQTDKAKLKKIKPKSTKS